jgi:hypothetical protein
LHITPHRDERVLVTAVGWAVGGMLVAVGMLVVVGAAVGATSVAAVALLLCSD